MKFGQPVRWLDGAKWHQGTVIGSYGNNVIAVTHVLNPDGYTKPDCKVRLEKGAWRTFVESINSATQAYTNPSMREQGKYQPATINSDSVSVGLGSLLYRKSWADGGVLK